MIYNIYNIGEELEEEEEKKPLPPSLDYSYAIGGCANDKFVTWENSIEKSIEIANMENRINQISLAMAQASQNNFLIDTLRASNYNIANQCFQMGGYEIPRESVWNCYHEIFKK